MPGGDSQEEIGMAQTMICLHDRGRIEAFLRANTFLHIYALGDLDDRLWPNTTWYALAGGDQIQAIALMYSGLAVPTLLALGEKVLPALRDLVRSIRPLLPARFYAHLSGDLSRLLSHYRIDSHGPHYKMALVKPGRLVEAGEGVQPALLSAADLEELQRFYQVSFPEAAFEPGMLAIGPYVGVRVGGQLVSVAGVHVYSPAYRVAALAAIATRPDCRGKGYAKMAVSSLCRELLRSVDHIGLNVKANNASAIRCYEALGFLIVAQYEEAMVQHV
jgi:ribosomal protein S18 acetylase RimI-like enzyme